jgi:DNA-3-methyladenine glycosylase
LNKVLERSFFSRRSTVVAKELIGKILVRKLNTERYLRGIIVETEAYGGLKDPASHAYGGLTKRNEAMFGEAGFSYVYFTYGFHHCLNVVTGKIGDAQAVLLRALEPIEGLDSMRKFRGDKFSDVNLTNGPGKICEALNIDRSLNKVDVTESSSQIFIEQPANDEKGRIHERRIVASSRIGITAGLEKRWRFFESSSNYVSHRSKLNLPRKPQSGNSRP